jgi:hypothetical protein
MDGNRPDRAIHDETIHFAAVVDPADRLNYMAAVTALYGRDRAAIVRRVMFRAQDATRAAIRHENDAHPALFRGARKPCRWDR